MYRWCIKRLLDIAMATLALCLLSPFFLVLMLFCCISNQGGVFFLQVRPGKQGRLFKVVKFKTMLDKRGPDGKLLPDGERVTRMGHLLRKTSLDELPQLLNVIKGDMSLVGPRPLLPEYLPLYTTLQHRRHEVRPGMTGWAQVNGRNMVEWNERFQYDVWYVDHVSFRMDLKILWLTVIKVMQAEGVDIHSIRSFTGEDA